jgi:HEPN domain-containing protein
MADILKQIEYWQNGAEEDWQVACDLVSRNKTRHGLFFAHLALEKILKAHVCRITQKYAPKVHNLITLLKLSQLDVLSEHFDALSEMNAFNMEGRYPIAPCSTPTQKEAQVIIDKCSEAFQWLIRQL